MKAKYVCPKCRTNINIGNQIILTGKTKTGLKGIVILKSELGDYCTLFSEDFDVVEGNKVSLSCPICRATLSTPKEKNLAHLIIIDENNNESTIQFSQILGERCTYKIKGDKIIQAFGEHQEKYKPDWLVDEL